MKILTKIKHTASMPNSDAVVGAMPKIKRSKKTYLVLICIVLITILLVAGVIYIIDRKNTEKIDTDLENYKKENALVQKNGQEQAVSALGKKASGEIKIGTTPEEKANYYTDVLTYYLLVNNQKQLAEYYARTVHPSGIKITRTDVKERVITEMAGSGYSTEMKGLIAQIVTDYQTAYNKADAAIKPEIQKKIDYYKQLGKTI